MEKKISKKFCFQYPTKFSTMTKNNLLFHHSRIFFLFRFTLVILFILMFSNDHCACRLIFCSGLKCRSTVTLKPNWVQTILHEGLQWCWMTCSKNWKICVNMHDLVWFLALLNVLLGLFEFILNCWQARSLEFYRSHRGELSFLELVGNEFKL